MRAITYSEGCVHTSTMLRQEFVNCDDEAAILHTALDDARAKLVDYHAKLRNKIVADVHNSMATKSSSVVGTKDIQGRSKVITKGRSKSKRLESELEKSIKKFIRRSRRNQARIIV
ncbi:uncharacterized protein DS421_7g213190 [Arachis hypogaea]|nr:uncharacterized protein DS421_7g213190 [Arachis hypogaea]